MYEIPKIQVPVSLTLVNGESIPGMMFVTEDLLSPAGNPDVEGYLNNDSIHFFSFKSGTDTYRSINKAHVSYIETRQDDHEVKARTPLEPRFLVLHFANNSTLDGVVYPTQSEESRVSDILNQAGGFISIYRQGKKIVVNRSQIVYADAN